MIRVDNSHVLVFTGADVVELRLPVSSAALIADLRAATAAEASTRFKARLAAATTPRSHT